ncbi:transcriptional regulatory protein LEU3 [Exophiala viscosa]|uniref:Transcriptional regulatory protein LEU3 n=1 Tax=Exophiala viscosa TaxID=2486360 RepID=A0AAN6DW13_9EURO|nr:transcriptional regulatory protein LEU3 [Exophiala viscosa]
MSRQCTISEPFRREHKRKRISELELRTDELQERLRTSSQSAQPEVPALPERSWAAVNSNDHQTAETESRLASVAPFFRDANIAPVSFRSFPPPAETLQTPESLLHDQPVSGTLPRSLDALTVEAKDIDAIFLIYFRDYASLMPILDPTTSPNAYYGLSPFLFWTIIGVGCRTYPKDPTLLAVLPSKLYAMALPTINSNVNLQIVLAWLLILYWPFPKAATGQDLIYPMSGALIHMAMQLGLHHPVSGQEFSKVPIRLSEEDTKRRAETWGYCMLVYQRSCLCKGISAMPILDIPHDPEQRRVVFQNISTRLKFELKLQDVLTRCSIAVSQNGLRTMSAEQERSLDTLLNLFQAQVTSVGLDYASDLDHLYVQLSSLQIQMFNLYKSPAAQDPTSLYDLCTVSCQVLETFDKLDKLGQISLPASGIFFYHSIMVPCHILLRLLKTSFARYIDVERAKAALFLGISLNKRLSLQNDDIPARNAVALTQLWTSNRVFRRPNGTEAVALRVRSRLAASMVLDGIVWWREETGAFMGVYPPPMSRNEDTPANENGVTNHANGIIEPAMATMARPEYSNFLDDPMLAELGWPVGEDIFSSLWTDETLGAVG